MSDMAEADLSAWLTKKQVAERLGVSEKSVERYHQRGLLSMATLKRPRQVPVRVYKPEDVERLAAQLEAERQAVMVGHLIPHQHQHQAAPAVIQPKALPELAAAVKALIEAVASRPEPPAYISLEEAAALAGLSRDAIREAAQAGEIKTRRYGSGVRYRRADVLKL